jgi:hypothetical protein
MGFLKVSECNASAGLLKSKWRIYFDFEKDYTSDNTVDYCIVKCRDHHGHSHNNLRPRRVGATSVRIVKGSSTQTGARARLMWSMTIC